MHSFVKSAVFAACVLALSGFSRAAPLAATQLSARGANDVHNGMGTYYNTEAGTGACGWYNNNGEHVMAISQSLWDETSNGQGGSTSCGRTATIKYNGKSVKVKVVDLCPECGYNDIDLSPSAFEALASKDVGRLNVSWKFK